MQKASRGQAGRVVGRRPRQARPRPLRLALGPLLLSLSCLHPPGLSGQTEAETKAVSRATGRADLKTAGPGRQVYAAACGRCHGAEGQGSEAGPPLRGAAFVAKWRKGLRGPSRPSLADSIAATMPPDAPGSLSLEDLSAVLLHLEQTNHADFGRTPSAAPEPALPSSEWPFYGGDAGSQRYSPLSQIDGANFGALRIAWRWKTDNFGPEPEYNYRATPIMVGGTLYVTAGTRRVVAAIDAKTGETLWTWRVDEGARANAAPRANSGRGVAYWSEDGEARILVVTPGFQLVALDAESGRPVESFGRAGFVDLKRGLDREIDPTTAPIGSTSPPIVVGDVVVVGSALADGSRPPARSMPPGHVRGYDVRTGKRRWIFHTIPHPGEVGYETWPEGAWRTDGNTAVWTTLSADLERGLVYLPVEAATGDFWGGHRVGDNLFAQSLVCLDARTGKRRWHFQTVHHDVWDYDLPAAPILLDVEHEGRLIPAVVQLTKQGFSFVFDRVTGEPLWPIEERAVAPSTVLGEQLSPTQPFPTRPPPFEPQGVREEDVIDFTPALRAEALEILASYRVGPLYTPGILRGEGGKLGTLMRPGTVGGANWPGGAVDPETGTLYVGSSTSPGLIGLGSDPTLSPIPIVLLGYPMPGLAPGGGTLPLFKPPWGRITAIDLKLGEHAWMVPNGEPHPFVAQHPALEGIELGRTGRPDRAGLLVTKTMLVAGEGGGMYGLPGGGGPMLRAHDKATGQVLAELELPANQTGVPMTYALDGRQYLVLAVGGPNHPGELVALRLPD
jgi:quinoprotein glucose dehydrogenase